MPGSLHKNYTEIMQNLYAMQWHTVGMGAPSPLSKTYFTGYNDNETAICVRYSNEDSSTGDYKSLDFFLLGLKDNKVETQESIGLPPDLTADEIKTLQGLYSFLNNSAVKSLIGTEDSGLHTVLLPRTHQPCSLEYADEMDCSPSTTSPRSTDDTSTDAGTPNSTNKRLKPS